MSGIKSILVAACVAMTMASPSVIADDASLWDRLGGEEKIVPLVAAAYERHATDPLTAPWFGEGKFQNSGVPSHVKQMLLEFFSAGIGGPYEYTGRSMPETHYGMDLPLDAYHAVVHHLAEQMEALNVGGPGERAEVADILRSLESEVRTGKASLWDRLGGEEKIVPLVAAAYERHTTDPLTAPWFGEGKYQNSGVDSHVKQMLLEFFSAGIGGPYEYTGRSMEEVHKGMNIPSDAYHAILFHIVEKMEELNVGSPADRHEVVSILRSLEAVVREQDNEEENNGKDEL